MKEFDVTGNCQKVLANAAEYTSDIATLVLVIPVCLAVSFFLGWCFYLGVERRFLNTARANPSSDKAPLISRDDGKRAVLKPEA